MHETVGCSLVYVCLQTEEHMYLFFFNKCNNNTNCTTCNPNKHMPRPATMPTYGRTSIQIQWRPVCSKGRITAEANEGGTHTRCTEESTGSLGSLSLLSLLSLVFCSGFGFGSVSGFNSGSDSWVCKGVCCSGFGSVGVVVCSLAKDNP